MKVVVAAALLAACGRFGFDATHDVSGDGAPAGDGSGSGCIEPAATLTIHAGDNLWAALTSLSAGAIVEVEAGTYTNMSFMPLVWTGTAAQPIIVRNAMGARPKLVSTPGNNVLDLDGAYFTLRGFELTGADEGVRLGAVSHAVLDDLVIHDVVDQGVTCNRPAQSCDALTLRRLVISNTSNTQTGSGITLGCSPSSGTCTTTNSLVEGCFVHDLSGTAGAGISVWQGGNVIVRDNVFVRTAGPGISVQITPATGHDLVERNFVSNALDNGIQLEGEVTVQNNVILGGTNDGIHSRTEVSAPPVNVTIAHNTIIGAAAACVHGLNWIGTSQTVANNAYSCATAETLSGTPVVAGSVLLVTGDVGAAPNVYPTASSRVIDAGDPGHGVADDFNGTSRTGRPDSGAYEHTSASNPGWIPAESLKPLLAPSCP